MSKRANRKKGKNRRQTNWWLIGGIIFIGVALLFGLMAVSATQEAEALTLASYCQDNPENCAAQGRLDAPVTIVEVSDFGCPHCRDFHQQTLPLLEERYIDGGRVQWISFPFAFRYETLVAASAALCAGEQDAYFEFSESLFDQFESPERLTAAGLRQTAASLDLDAAAFEQCLADERYHDTVQTNMNVARSLRIDSTPTFFINGRKLSGAQPFAAFQQQIEAALQAGE